jgi:hypothetical protein
MTRWLLIAAAATVLSGTAPPSQPRPHARSQERPQERSEAGGSTDEAIPFLAPLEVAQAPERQPAPGAVPVPQLLWRSPGPAGTSDALPPLIVPVPQPAVRPQRLAALPEPQLGPVLPTPKRAPRHDRPSGARLACLKGAARELFEQIEAQFGPMQIISTCRAGARIAGSGRPSKHASGEAVDFHAGRRKGDVVRWLIANHKSGGTMTYADMDHIHIDIGRHFVALNAPSGR